MRGLDETAASGQPEVTVLKSLLLVNQKWRF
jgi:hypothetical protein